MTALRLNAVRLFVTDLPPALAFYRDVLGLPLRSAGDDYALFDAGGVDIVVEPSATDERGRPLAGRFTGLSFGVEDAQAAHARLAALGVRLHGPPELQLWGGVLVTFEDPAGNELQLVQLPS